jgi:hypothetical protein
MLLRKILGTILNLNFMQYYNSLIVTVAIIIRSRSISSINGGNRSKSVV